VLPSVAEQTGKLLHKPIRHWDESKTPLVGAPVAKFKHMLRRAELSKVEAMIESSKEETPGDQTDSAGVFEDSDDALRAEPLAQQIAFDDFKKVDLRIARVIAAEDVPQTRRLIKLTLSLGGTVRRTVLAGVKEAYRPEDLVGRLVVLAANLAPRKMKFGTSEGMILASGPGGKNVFILGVDDGAVPGQRVQ
jgi:methionyl-tRNA synthetase